MQISNLRKLYQEQKKPFDLAHLALSKAGAMVVALGTELFHVSSSGYYLVTSLPFVATRIYYQGAILVASNGKQSVVVGQETQELVSGSVYDENQVLGETPYGVPEEVIRLSNGRVGIITQG